MKTKDLFFNLPQELIAQYPSERRGESRLLVLNRESGNYIDSKILDVGQYLPQGSLLVLNNSRVRKARLYGESEGGGRFEFLFLYPLEEAGQWVTMISKQKRHKVGKRFTFNGSIGATIVGECGEGRVVQFDTPIDENFFETYGHVPLPPYIKREDVPLDEQRYQTVYAQKSGSVAAPTAGLHFTNELLEQLANDGIESCYLTLHVGQGTFIPIRSSTLEEHPMHTERYEVSQEAASTINSALREGRPIIAVGTTSVRTLESAFDPASGEVMAGSGSTNIFIYPPYNFKVISGLLTNFHTPESTLLALVSALAGKENIFKAYHHAIEERYHFFSYGDAMLII